MQSYPKTAESISLVEVEFLRISRKGLLNNLMALTLFILLVYSTHTIGSVVWTHIGIPLVEMLGHKWFMVVVGSAVHTVTALSCLCVFLPAYMGRGSWLDKYRVVQGDTKQWHWQRPTWKQLKTRTIQTLLSVHLICFPIGIWMALKNTKVIFEGFPTIPQFFFQVLFLIYMDDIFFYLSHRLLHHSLPYKYIHKKHHEYEAPFSIISQYAHPVEYFFGNMLPSVFGIAILGSRLHIFTYLIFSIHKIVGTNQTHSGFEVPWSPVRILPFANPTSHHNFHHSKNVGTYGGFTYVWDHFGGSNAEYYRMTYGLK